MATAADLNAYANAAEYDGMAAHYDDPDTDAGIAVAPGGDKVAITMGVAGAAGVDPGRYPATPGRNYSTPAVFTLTGPARYVSLWVGTEYRRRAKLAGPIGPGTYPIVYALNARTDNPI